MFCKEDSLKIFFDKQPSFPEDFLGKGYFFFAQTWNLQHITPSGPPEYEFSGGIVLDLSRDYFRPCFSIQWFGHL
ncbi:Uncharacterized protein dnm_027460 [Desulfonema magnum]|uniref:Uncharacterized protein n=1 Tax=Desulfonema magnum TaxID=45655 RepID=A0A975BJI2_9BACT|nr:Uncharacterized protein dnm_027460 [Desulfonema magnum]